MRRGIRWLLPLLAVAVAVPAAPAVAAPAGAGAVGPAEVVLVSSTGQRVTAAEVAATTGLTPTMTTRAIPNRVSGGGMGTDSIIDGESRTRVALNNVFPNSAITFLHFSDGAGCTGFLVDANTVITAGHCVYDFYNGGGWRPGVTVIPGKNGTKEPFGSCTSSYFFASSAWVNSGAQAGDYGAIILSCDIGADAGWFPLYSASASLVNKRLTATGYPGVTPDSSPWGTMWQDTNIATFDDRASVGFKADVTEGQSGSPLFASTLTSSGTCKGVCAAGIVTNNGSPNWGVRFGPGNMPDITYFQSQ